jgi:hypothetical protein
LRACRILYVKRGFEYAENRRGCHVLICSSAGGCSSGL